MKFGWKGALGLVVTAVCLYFAFRNGLGQARRTGEERQLLPPGTERVAATGMFPLARFDGARFSILSRRSCLLARSGGRSRLA